MQAANLGNAESLKHLDTAVSKKKLLYKNPDKCCLIMRLPAAKHTHRSFASH